MKILGTKFGRTSSWMVCLALISAFYADAGYSQGRSCPIAGLSSRLPRSCATVDEIHDPAGHLGVRAGDAPSDGVCIRPSEARFMESMLCGAAQSGSLQVRDGSLIIPFSLLRSQFRLRPGISLTDEGTVAMRIDPASDRLVMIASGKYTRSGHPSAKHSFRSVLSMPLRGSAVAPPPADALDHPHTSDSSAASHTISVGGAERDRADSAADIGF